MVSFVSLHHPIGLGLISLFFLVEVGLLFISTLNKLPQRICLNF